MVAALARKEIDLRVKSEVTAVSAITAIPEKLVVYKASRFIPVVAARDRRPMLNGLRLFNEQHPSRRYFRYVVVTRGEVIPVGGPIREAIKDFQRRLSRWSSWSREEGVEVLFRSTEFTRKTASERGMTDQYPPDTALFHIHANLQTWPTRRMSDVEWQTYLKSSWHRLGAHWQDNGRVENEAELVKYCFKPAELSHASDEELAWLFTETRRLHFTQPMGPFAEFLATLEKDGEKIAHVRPGGGDHPTLMKVKKAKRFNHAPRQRPDGGECAPFAAGEPPTNIILGITLPQWRHSPWAEPSILVQRYDPTATGKPDRERLREIDLESRILRDRWDAAGAPPPEEALRIAQDAIAGRNPSDGPARRSRRRRRRL